jgi:hypothetical protein
VADRRGDAAPRGPAAAAPAHEGVGVPGLLERFDLRMGEPI